MPWYVFLFISGGIMFFVWLATGNLLLTFFVFSVVPMISLGFWLFTREPLFPNWIAGAMIGFASILMLTYVLASREEEGEDINERHNKVL